MQAEVVAIGTELLLGEIIDTNSSWIAQQLTTLGLNLYYTHTVGDNAARISEVLRTCVARSDVVITTGGLGPTVDDWTREAAADAFGRSLELHEELLEEIAAFFNRRGRVMTDNNRKQAFVPAGSQVIHNPVGTAPCFLLEQDGHILISLPGVPFEMKHLMQTQVLPLLRERFHLSGIIKSRVLHTCSIGESALSHYFTDLMGSANPTVGTAAHPGQTDIRITAKAESEAQVMQLIEPMERELRARIGRWIYGVDADTLPGIVCGLLHEQHLTLGTYETVCAGQLGSWMAQETAAPGCYLGSVALTHPINDLLSAPLEALRTNPESSQEEADQAANAVRQILHSDLGLAVTGRSEQDAADDSPAYIALSTPTGVKRITSRHARTGPNGRGWLLHYAVDMVRRYLLQLPLE